MYMGVRIDGNRSEVAALCMPRRLPRVVLASRLRLSTTGAQQLSAKGLSKLRTAELGRQLKDGRTAGVCRMFDRLREHEQADVNHLGVMLKACGSSYPCA